VRYTGPRKNNSTGDTTYYYTCNRNGSYQSEAATPRVREMKGTGTKKIQCTCPASMTVIVNDSGYHVTYVSTHDGHKLALGHLALTKQERKNIAGNCGIRMMFCILYCIAYVCNGLIIGFILNMIYIIIECILYYIYIGI
jgi:hypothetical protein